MTRRWVVFPSLLPIFCAAALAFACSSAELKATPGQGGSSSSGDDGTGGGDEAGADGAVQVTLPDGGVVQVPTSDVTIQVEPSDLGKAVLDAIKATKTSLHMTMYLLTDDKAINALIALKNAGKEVKIVLNQNFPPNGGSNTDSYNTLKSAGVNVVWAPSAYTFTHAKTIIIDGSKLLVMTMNLTYSSPSTNREYIATDLDAQDIKDADTLFDADYRNVASQLATTKLVLSPRTATSLDAKTRLIALIRSATKTLDVEVESLSEGDMVDAIIAAKNAGVDVKVVLDQGTLSSAGQQDAVTKLKAASVAVHALGTPDVHAKAIVVDSARAYVGSQNFTATSLNSNREIGIVTANATSAQTIEDTIVGDFGKGTTP